MQPIRISASSYSNTAPLVWSFLYGRNRGRVELIMDAAPSRSAQLLAENRVDAALVPVIAFQMLDDVRLIPDVCVGAKQRVRSVCLITRGKDLGDVRSVALDTSSLTSVALTKIIFREFLTSEPEWRGAEPDPANMLAMSDAALIIGDPALILSHGRDPDVSFFDLAEIWHEFTASGFVFAMWMSTRAGLSLDLAAARDEGLNHVTEIARNYEQIGLNFVDMENYLTEDISYSVDESMARGMKMYFELAAKHGLIPNNKPLAFTN